MHETPTEVGAILLAVQENACNGVTVAFLDQGIPASFVFPWKTEPTGRLAAILDGTVIADLGGRND